MKKGFRKEVLEFLEENFIYEEEIEIVIEEFRKRHFIESDIYEEDEMIFSSFEFKEEKKEEIFQLIEELKNKKSNLIKMGLYKDQSSIKVMGEVKSIEVESNATPQQAIMELKNGIKISFLSDEKREKREVYVLTRPNPIYSNTTNIDFRGADVLEVVEKLSKLPEDSNEYSFTKEEKEELEEKYFKFGNYSEEELEGILLKIEKLILNDHLYEFERGNLEKVAFLPKDKEEILKELGIFKSNYSEEVQYEYEIIKKEVEKLQNNPSVSQVKRIYMLLIINLDASNLEIVEMISELKKEVENIGSNLEDVEIIKEIKKGNQKLKEILPKNKVKNKTLNKKSISNFNYKR